MTQQIYSQTTTKGEGVRPESGAAVMAVQPLPLNEKASVWAHTLVIVPLPPLGKAELGYRSVGRSHWRTDGDLSSEPQDPAHTNALERSLFTAEKIHAVASAARLAVTQTSYPLDAPHLKMEAELVAV